MPNNGDGTGQVDEAWLRDARQSELQKLFAYVVLAATMFFGQVTVWGLLGPLPRSRLPPFPAVVVFVIGTDFMLVAFGLLTIARYDLVARIERRMHYPEQIVKLIASGEDGLAGWASAMTLSTEYVFFGADPKSLSRPSASLRALHRFSQWRIIGALLVLIIAVLGMSWLILRIYI